MNEIMPFSLNNLPKLVTRGKKRVGRGYGSGKGGHTSGRGQKGQRSRRTIPWSFEGGGLALNRRLPFWRGKGKLQSYRPQPVAVNLRQLEMLPNDTTVDKQALVKIGLVKLQEFRRRGVKILARGKLTKKLTIVGLPVSAPAKAKIETAGGSIIPS